MKSQLAPKEVFALAFVAALAALLSLMACHLAKDDPETDVFSFPSLGGSLAGADTATILLLDTNRNVIDTLFDGPVVPGARFQGLEAEHYRGGLVIISIEASRGGVLFYQEERLYDGNKQDLLSSTPIRVPNATVAIQWPNPRLTAGDTLALPPVSITPENLANRSLGWISRNQGVLEVDAGTGRLRAVGAGSSRLIAFLRSDTAKKDSVQVDVMPSEMVQSLTLEPKALNLFLNGEGQTLSATLLPSSLGRRLTWRSADTSVARVDAAGKVSPGKTGMAYVTVLANADSGMRDSSLVTVKQDTPRIQAGLDTVIAIGGTVAFKLEVFQEYGGIAMFKWDLDGNGAYEDSSTAIRGNLSRHFPVAGEFSVRFYVRDSEGNEATANRKVTAVNGRVVQFHSPANGSYVNRTPIDVTWSVDGVRQTSSETLSEGQNTILKTAVDSAGNTYSATLTVHLDTQPPRVRIIGPEEGMLTRQATVPVAWTVDDAVQASRNTESLAGKQGRILIVRDALDAAGNRGVDTVAVYRDTLAPAAVTFVSPTSPSVVNAGHTLPVQWAWTRTGEAIDSFLVSLNGAPAVRQGGTSYVLANAGNQSYTLQVQEVDAAGNLSEAVSRTLLVDKVAPPPPAVTGATPTGAPIWNWTAGSGSDGARIYRYRLAPDTAYSDEGAASSYAPTGLVSGTYTLFVQERDAAGNWSTEGSHGLLVDRAGPTLTVSGPSERGRVANFNPKVFGTVEDDNQVRRVEYRVNATGYLTADRTGGDWNFTASYNTGANTVWIRGEDGFGNRDSTRITIYKYPQVIFVRKGVTGTGKSWEDAYGEIHQALVGSTAYQSGTQIWVTKGKYEVLPNLGERFVVPWSNFGIYGGFDDEAASADTSGRDFTFGATSLGDKIYIEKPEGSVNNVVIDGFSFVKNGFSYLGIQSGSNDQEIIVRNIKVRDLVDDNGVLNLNSRDNRLENCEFSGNNWSEGMGVTLGTNTKMVNCTFINNQAPAFYAPLMFKGFLEVRGGVFRENYGSGENGLTLSHFSISEGQVLDIDDAIVQRGVSAIHRGDPPAGTLIFGTGNREN